MEREKFPKSNYMCRPLGRHSDPNKQLLSWRTGLKLEPADVWSFCWKLQQKTMGFMSTTHVVKFFCCRITASVILSLVLDYQQEVKAAEEVLRGPGPLWETEPQFESSRSFTCLLFSSEPTQSLTPRTDEQDVNHQRFTVTPTDLRQISTVGIFEADVWVQQI